MDATDRIQELAMTFPSLARRREVADWDPHDLDAWARMASHGERLAVQFILHVWNQFHEYECGGFDVFEAYRAWDTEHWSAFQAWAREPFTL